MLMVYTNLLSKVHIIWALSEMVDNRIYHYDWVSTLDPMGHIYTWINCASDLLVYVFILNS